jgi:hypothetical protein
MKITKIEEAKQLLLNTQGKTFNVGFIKRSTGELREMNARLGVKKHLKGGDLPYDPFEKDLLPVFDMQKRGYRSISLDTIKYIKFAGETYLFYE